MSAIRHLARAAAVAGAALGTTFAVAAPAAAADASCQLSRLPSRMSAGGEGAPVVGQVRSSNRETLDVVQVRWRIRRSGLDADEVALSDVTLQKDDGEVRGTEEVQSVGPFGRSVSHTLQFLPGAPSGRTTLTMQVFLLEGGDWKDACSSRVTTTVQAARAGATPSASPLPLETALAGASTPPAAAVDAPPPGADSDSNLWPLYLLGLLLLAGGGGLVAFLLLRRPRDEHPPAYQPAYVAGYGGHQTTPAAYEPPTVVYDARAYPPPVDPFGLPGGDTPTAIIPAIRDEPPDAGGPHRRF